MHISILLCQLCASVCGEGLIKCCLFSLLRTMQVSVVVVGRGKRGNTGLYSEIIFKIHTVRNIHSTFFFINIKSFN